MGKVDQSSFSIFFQKRWVFFRSVPMYTSRVSLCIGIVGVHPSYPSSPVGFYKPIMDISSPGSIYHHSCFFFHFGQGLVGSACSNLSPFCTALWPTIRFLWCSTSGDWEFFLMGKHNIYRILFRSSYRFKTVSLSLCTTAGMLKMIQTFEFHRLHRWTLRYIATEKWKDFTVGSRKFVLNLFGFWDTNNYACCTKNQCWYIHVPLRGKWIPSFSEHN